MRCGCRDCDAFMIHSEGAAMACVCPECGFRCNDCLGTNTVVPREAFLSMKRSMGEDVDRGEKDNDGNVT